MRHFPLSCQQMPEAAARPDPQARVWRGEGHPAQRVRVLDPIGHEEFVQAEFRATTEKHRLLVERIPLVQDLQNAWLLLLFCANTRATHSLCGVPPVRDSWASLIGQTRSMIGPVCHSRWVGADCGAPPECVSLLLGPTGTDSLRMIHNRHPEVAATIVRCLSGFHRRCFVSR